MFIIVNIKFCIARTFCTDNLDTMVNIFHDDIFTSQADDMMKISRRKGGIFSIYLIGIRKAVFVIRYNEHMT